MNEEAYQTTLNHVIARLSRLENELMELRQLLHSQMPHLAYSTNQVSYTSIQPNESHISGLTAAEDAHWQVTCLGNFRLRCFGCDLALCHSRRGQSILKYLLARPGYAASSEALIECFWPNVDPAAGAHSLQVAVHALRCSLRGCGPNGSNEAVLFRNNIYFLNPALNIVQDVDDFQAAYERGQRALTAGQQAEAKKAFEEARSLYTGDYLADCYEEWASGRRLALLDMQLALLVQLGHLYSQGMLWEPAISCYHQALSVDCYREDIYRHLMRCYVACGRQADVERTYRTCQERLHRDLHISPAPETSVLYKQLIQQPARSDTN